MLATIERLRLLQIDSIQIVARSPFLVLFSRLGAYDSRWLGELLAEGRIFECWAHEACFASVNDRSMLRAISRPRHWAMRRAQEERRRHGLEMDQLLAEIARRGPSRASDFRGTHGAGGWWSWKSEKRWLEALFAEGRLGILRREGFQRVYDLAERVEVAWPAPATRAEAGATLAAVSALGVTQAAWINDYFRLDGRLADADLDDLVADGRLLRVAVSGWEAPGYVHPEHAPLLRRAAQDGLRASRTSLLSPFDPLVWDRRRAAAMFGFDYRLECYVPAAKRRYGYYVLPILHRGRLVGRLDAKAHREPGVFEVKGLWLEPGQRATAELARPLHAALRRCAAWHGTPRLEIVRSEPPALRCMLEAAGRRSSPIASPRLEPLRAKAT